MSLKQKLKGIKKRWYFLVALILLAVIGGGVKYNFENHSRAQFASFNAQQTYRQVCADLVYLENFQSMKLTQEEAKGILPLIDRLASSTDQNLQIELAKEIYGQLTPQQYAFLLEQQKGNQVDGFLGKEKGRIQDREKGREQEDNIRDEKEFRGDRGFDKKGSSIREEALGNVVEKMLTDLSQGKSM